MFFVQFLAGGGGGGGGSGDGEVGTGVVGGGVIIWLLGGGEARDLAEPFAIVFRVMHLYSMGFLPTSMAFYGLKK